MTPELAGRRPVRPSVAFTGAALWLGFDEEGYARAYETWLQDWLRDRSQPQERPSDPRYDVSVVLHDGLGTRSTTLHGVHARFPIVQLLPDDEILVVGRRCRFTSERKLEEDNAYVFGWDGMERRHFILGDAIEDVQVSRAGQIWVSYFDEGVYGGLTWGEGDASGPPAAAGLIATDPWGKILWKYRPPAEVGPIDDCYALNVSDDETWAYYYSEFPLVRIGSRREATAWKTQVVGARAFAVAEGRVLFFGGYKDRRSDSSLWELGDGVLENPREVALLKPGGARFEGKKDVLVGKGGILHAFDGPRWCQIDCATWPTEHYHQRGSFAESATSPVHSVPAP